MKTLINPTGSASFTVGSGESFDLLLKDMRPGSREFALEITGTGEGSDIRVRGVASAKGKDQKKWRVSIRLSGKNGRALLDLRGAADGTSSLEFQGSGVVASDSSGGSVDVREHIILLSPDAKGRALPVLRVETDDVESAGHSASVSSFPEDLLFFLESRGIDKKKAKSLLLKGFLSPISSLS